MKGQNYFCFYVIPRVDPVSTSAGVFILSTVFAQQESHLFGAAIIQLIVSGELVVDQFCKGLGVLHVAVSGYEIKEEISLVKCPI